MKYFMLGILISFMLVSILIPVITQSILLGIYCFFIFIASIYMIRDWYIIEKSNRVNKGE